MKNTNLIIFVILSTLIFGCTGTSEKSKEQEISKLSESELQTKTLDELRILRNEVYARKGYIFKSGDLTEYFNNQEWYEPKYSNSDILLTQTELDYVNLILSLESELQKKYVFNFTIDEEFLKSNKYDPNQRLNNLANPQYAEPEREAQYRVLKEKVEYYVLDTFKLNQNISGRLISAEWPNFSFDGTLKLIFLATYNNKLEQVDVIRVYKYSMVSDYFVTEQSEILDGDIRKSIEITTIIDDEGNVGTTNTEHLYQIQSNGQIRKI